MGGRNFFQSVNSRFNNFNYAQNAEFRFWQRQTPANATNRQDDQYGPDRWYILTSGGAVNVGVAQTTADTASSFLEVTPFAALVRNTDASDRQFGIAQILENDRVTGLRGKKVTFAFQIKEGTSVPNIRAAIVEWTGTADSVTSDIVSSWAANPTLIANAAFVGTPADFALSSAPGSQFSVTATLGTTFTNLILFVWTPAAEALNNDFQITQVQLVESPTPLPWAMIRKSYAEDLEECQRFYEKSYAIGTAPATAGTVGQIQFIATVSGATRGTIHFATRKRTSPTVVFYSPQNAGVTGSWYDATSGLDRSVSANTVGETDIAFDATSTNAYVANSGDTIRGHWSADAEL